MFKATTYTYVYFEIFSNGAASKSCRLFKFWSKSKILENLVKIEDLSNFGKNLRFLKNLSKLKIFENLVKNEDF